MAYTRSNGANARAQRWDEADERGRSRGNWLPLEALEEEELFTATPQLRAMPAPRRQVFAPARPKEAPLRQTEPQPSRVTSPQREARREKSRAQSEPRGVQARAVGIVAGGLLCALVLYGTVSAAVEWTQVKLDDLQYGRPRTFQMDAYVGHGEAAGAPTHFVAMNLNRRVTVLELPGGDSTKTTTIVGPYLFGQGEDLTPVQAAAQDVNGDGKPDLVVSVKNEQLIYLNDGTSFKLITPEERAALQKSLEKASATAGTGAANAAPQESSK